MVAVGPGEQVSQRPGGVVGPDDQRLGRGVEVGGEAGWQVAGRGAVGEVVADGGRAALGAQALGGGVGGDLAADEEDEPVGQVLGLVDVVGGQHDGGAGGGQVLDRRPRPAAGFGVEPGGRLVEEEDLGAADDADGHVDPAALTPGEGADAGLGVVGQVDQFEDLARPAGGSGRARRTWPGCRGR